MAMTTSPVTQTGSTLTFTVTTAAGDRDQYESIPGRVTVDPDGDGPIQPATVDYVAKKKLPTPSAFKITDDSGRVWTVASDTGTVTTFTATV